jgi:FtsP/CotA-like multicopper oxidase with cupredoxin domain
MIHRRNLFGLGVLGSAGALLSWPTPRAQTARPVLDPFRDDLPLPPPPQEFPWSPGGPLPFADLDAEARTYVDPTQAAGKAGFFRLRAEVRKVRMHSQLPDTEIWGYADDNPADKPWPYAMGPTFKRFLSGDNRYAGTIVRHVNRLPADAEHRGFGEPFTTTHLHGAHVPFRFDGFPGEIELSNGTPFHPVSARGEVFDYAYPLLDPGFSTGAPGRQTERPSTLWYHDHFLDFTAPNVYRGLAGFFLTNDALDTGEEATGLGLPGGAFDVPLVLHEKTFDLNGQLVYDVFNTDGFMGKEYMVNGMVRPRLHVKRRKYRFRFLNGSNARIYQLFLCDKDGRSYPLTQIATEGGLLSRPVRNRPSVMLGMAERIEVVIDFNLFPHPKFTELFIENRMVQRDGRGPDGKFEDPELARRGTQILKFVLEEPVTDPSVVPDALRPFAVTPAAAIAAARVRRFEFERTNGQWAINDRLAGELKRVEANPPLAVGEVWRLVNKSGGWWHPIHVHHEFMRVIRRNGQLPFDGTGRDFGQSVERDGLARKDTIVLGPNSTVDVYVKFQDFKGPFVFHCHNMEHEDHQMMARFDVV